MNKTINYLTFLLFLQFGCTNKAQESNSNYGPGIAFKDTLTLSFAGKEKVIALDSLTSAERCVVQYQEDREGERLYLLNTLNNSFQQYNWKSGKITSSFFLPTEGPNGVGKVSSFLVAAEDSIYTLSTGSYKLMLLNAKGNVTKPYNLLKAQSHNQNIVAPETGSGTNMTNLGTQLFVCGDPQGDYKVKSFYEKGHVGIVLNLQTEKAEPLLKMPQRFASNYEKGYSLSAQQLSFGQAFNKRKNLVLINFPSEEYLYRLKLPSGQIDSVYAGGKNLKPIEYITNKRVEMHDEYRYFLQQHFYPSVFYDSYRQLYYRFLGIYNPAKKDIFNQFDGIYPLLFSVIILNDKMEKVGEVKLGKEHISSRLIITKEGIYIPRQDEDESKLIYKLYNVQRK